MLARISRWAGYEGNGANALDVGRGLAILAVMYGHTLAPWFMGAGDSFSEGAFLQWKFGAAFMMVFFFFLSGAGWREHRSLETTFRQAIALVLIAWLSSIALDLVFVAMTFAGWTAAAEQPPLVLYDVLRNAARSAVYGHDYSMSALWFLTALAVVRVIAALCARFGAAATWGVAGLLMALTLLSTEFGWRNFYQLNLIGVAFLAFIGGHKLRATIVELERRPTAAFALALMAGAVTIATFHLNEGCRWDWSARCGQGWLDDRFGVSMLIGQFGNLPLFALTAAAGIAFATALSVLLARFGAVVGQKLAVWGRASMNLLIVNCLVLELINPLLSRWVTPHADGDHLLFFLAAFALTLVVNLTGAELLQRPLRELRSFASWGGVRIVELGQAVLAIVTRCRLRVSQGHD